jgi:hypothetical protein
VVCREAEAPPAFNHLRYQPTTWPGARLPSITLQDGAPLYEKLEPWFALIAFDDAAPGDVKQTAERLGIPLRVLRLGKRDWRPVFERRLMLVRTDHHVTCRGDSAPPSWSTVLTRVSGH